MSYMTEATSGRCELVIGSLLKSATKIATRAQHKRLASTKKNTPAAHPIGQCNPLALRLHIPTAILIEYIIVASDLVYRYLQMLNRVYLRLYYNIDLGQEP